MKPEGLEEKQRDSETGGRGIIKAHRGGKGLLNFL